MMTMLSLSELNNLQQKDEIDLRNSINYTINILKNFDNDD